MGPVNAVRPMFGVEITDSPYVVASMRIMARVGTRILAATGTDTLSSETTAAASGQVGVVRRDPMAMLPFIGYNAGDYFGHWITLGKEADAAKLPKIYYVNWFRRDDDGHFIWPGFGENGRVLKWTVERLDGQAAASESPIGRVPTVDSLDIEGLDLTRAQVEECLRVDDDDWRAEVAAIAEWFGKFGDKLPTLLWASSTASRPVSV
jgi:phosphoenolpyruvate carboxykinase (GTP)